MQCKSCNTELPKNAKVCPKCGEIIDDKHSGNLKVIAVIGLIIALVGGLLPFVQNKNEITDAYSFMNIDMPVIWYIQIFLIIVAILLLVARRDMLSIIPTALSAVLFIIAFVAMDFRLYASRNSYELFNLTKLLSNSEYTIGAGTYVFVLGIIIAIAGCFIDIMKYFKKDLGVDKRFLTNSINQSIWKKMYYYRGFYLMFLPVLIMVLLFNYWPMLGCRYAFTKYIIRGPYYVGLYHFNQMFTNDIYFWQAFKNTLILSIVKLVLNTGAAVIISLLLNEIVSLGFKKTVQTIVYLPHFMSWVVVASVFKMILDPNVTGVVNGILLDWHVIDEPIFFMGSEQYWRGTFYVMNIWKDTIWVGIASFCLIMVFSIIFPERVSANVTGFYEWTTINQLIDYVF